MEYNYSIGLLLSSGMYVAGVVDGVLHLTHDRDEAMRFRSVSQALRWRAQQEDIDEFGPGLYTVLLSKKAKAV